MSLSISGSGVLDFGSGSIALDVDRNSKLACGNRHAHRPDSRTSAIARERGLDLVEVAYQMSIDNEQQVAQWMESGEIAQVSDAQAQEWLDANALMWSVVVRPWVLVQPVLRNSTQ